MNIFIFLIIFSVITSSHTMEEKINPTGFIQRFINYFSYSEPEIDQQRRNLIAEVLINDDSQMKELVTIDEKFGFNVLQKSIQKMIRNSPESELLIRECIAQSWENQNTLRNRTSRRLGQATENTSNFIRQGIMFGAGYGAGVGSEKVTKYCPSCTLF